MKDNIILATCLQIFCFWLVDYFDGHGFGVEALIASVNAIALMWVDRKDKR